MADQDHQPETQIAPQPTFVSLCCNSVAIAYNLGEGTVLCVVHLGTIYLATGFNLLNIWARFIIVLFFDIILFIFWAIKAIFKSCLRRIGILPPRPANADGRWQVVLPRARRNQPIPRYAIPRLTRDPDAGLDNWHGQGAESEDEQ
ncbi:hypothetical protein F4677DRAFT_407146 [Hypoxylon crocopeplum]|nr:hypothetical protein F4677DRAFT_407146 [Hypoxylon crocopeplum]